MFEHCRVAQRLAVKMLYGSGLRLMECLRLRIGDIDFSRRTVRVHAGNGGMDRVTVLSDTQTNISLDKGVIFRVNSADV